MKELTIEQKAQRYYEAFERAKGLYAKDAPDSLHLEELFPELKEIEESENEKIRKELIKFVKVNIPDEERYIAWLEKQGEQKETLCDKCKKTQPSHSCQDITALGRCAVEHEHKVELKFRKGDWIVHHGTENIYQVVAVIDNQYQLKYGNTYTIQKCADVDRCSRLYDVAKDAKSGDVLSDGTTIFIFKDLLSDGSVMSYCDYDTNSGESDAFCPLSVNLMCSKITPATKQQRELLFKKMYEAGYEWDAEKKELKKIEQQTAWSEEDEKMLSNIKYCIINLPVFYESININGENKITEQFICAAINWLKSLKDRFHIQTKQEWNEEDENNILFLTSIIEECFKEKEKITLCSDTVCANFTKEDVIDRLKSLRPQNWTKEDEERYMSCLQRLGTGNPEQPETINSKWFKEHVYPQTTWKPSEEQMRALHDLNLTGNISYTGQGQLLIDLYNNLKKL